MKANMLNIKSSMNLDGSIIEIDELFSRAASEGMTHVAITDDGSLHTIGYISHAVAKTGVKAVVGCLFPYQIGANNVRLALYPRTELGKYQLFELSTRYHLNDKKPFKLEKMKPIFDNMNIVIDSTTGDSRQVLETVRTLSALVDKKFLFVGIVDNYLQEKRDKNLHVKEVLVKEKVGYVVFNKVHFLDEEDFETYAHFLKFKSIAEPKIVEGYLLPKDELQSMFDYMEGVEECTQRVFDSTHVSYEIKQSNSKIPQYKIKDSFDLHPLFLSRFPDYQNNRSAAYLGAKVLEGLIERYGKNKTAIERALEELRVIIGKNFADYFLIVWDYIKYARDNGIPVGVRGSVLGSIVAYSLGITNICPLKYKLQFERFLNEFRADMPDIDVDVSQMHREKLISYIRRVYGSEYVGQIITRNSWGFKNVVSGILDKNRVPQDKMDVFWSFKPEEYESLEELLKAEPGVLEILKTSKDMQMLFKNAYKLKHLPRTTSTHAAGVIISSIPLKNQMPVKKDDSGNLLTQIPNDDNILEATGHPKMDVLGLRTLDTVDLAKKFVEKRTGQPFPVIDFSDEKTLSLIRSGNLLGVFQLESASASKFAQMMEISSFEELVILNAMNRPGPMDEIPIFVKKKGQPISITDVSGNVLEGVECLYEIVEETRGTLTFQEQINLIVQVWAGYSAAEADLFRRGISKKNDSLLLEEKGRFIEKAVQLGRELKTTEKLFELIYKFRDFGFNKSHATGYGVLSFETAYLKANYPIEFMAALLTTLGNANKKTMSTYIQEARRIGINILRPDINSSSETFEIVGDAIRCPLYIVSGVGQGTAKQIAEMKNQRPFKHIYDVVKRTEGVLDKGTLDKLLKAGVMDSLGNRVKMFDVVQGNQKNTEQDKMSNVEKSLQELEVCGLIFSISEKNQKQIIEKSAVKENCIVGIVANVLPMLDKYKKEMAKIKLITFDGNSENYVMFSREWKMEKNNFKEGSVILAQVDKSGAIKKAMQVNIS